MLSQTRPLIGQTISTLGSDWLMMGQPSRPREMSRALMGRRGSFRGVHLDVTGVLCVLWPRVSPTFDSQRDIYKTKFLGTLFTYDRE